MARWLNTIEYNIRCRFVFRRENENAASCIWNIKPILFYYVEGKAANLLKYFVTGYQPIYDTSFVRVSARMYFNSRGK